MTGVRVRSNHGAKTEDQKSFSGTWSNSRIATVTAAEPQVQATKVDDYRAPLYRQDFSTLPLSTRTTQETPSHRSDQNDRSIYNAPSSGATVIQCARRTGGMTRQQCIDEARAAANARAADVSDTKTGHGRGAHGRDAGGKAARYATPEAVAKRRQETWDLIYNQTLSRLLRENGHE